MIAYIMFLLNSEKEVLELDSSKESIEKDFDWVKVLLLLFVGFAFVVVGADFTVDSASKIAKSLGVSEWIVGIIMISLGTSMPELVVSIGGSLKG